MHTNAVLGSSTKNWQNSVFITQNVFQDLTVTTFRCKSVENITRLDSQIQKQIFVKIYIYYEIVLFGKSHQTAVKMTRFRLTNWRFRLNTLNPSGRLLKHQLTLLKVILNHSQQSQCVLFTFGKLCRRECSWRVAMSTYYKQCLLY